MDKKVQNQKGTAVAANSQGKPRIRERTGPTFQEELRSQGEGANRGLPVFPRHKARAKTITVDQAKALARYSPCIKNSAARHGVPIELICGVILQESGGNAKARSHAGAKGLMQLMDGTAKRFGVKNAYDPAQNIEGGTKYLRSLLDRYNGNVELSLAAYNAGELNVEKHGMKVPPFAETRNYVPNVLGYAQAMIEMLQAGPAPGGPSTVAIRGKLA